MAAKKRRPSNSVSLWRDKVWKLFSLYIRLRDRLEENGFPTEYGTCITCKKVFEWKSLQAGHFVPGRKPSVLFDERNCHAQCYACNCHKDGNLIEYYPEMLERYGEETVEELRWLSKQQKRFTVEELQELYNLYKAKVKKEESR